MGSKMSVVFTSTANNLVRYVRRSLRHIHLLHWDHTHLALIVGHAGTEATRLKLLRVGSMGVQNPLRGGVKKNCFFLLFVKKLRPPPPTFLTTSVYSDKDFFDSAQTPPPIQQKMVKKLPVFFYIKPPCSGKLCRKKSDKTLLNWMRPPPLWSKKSEYFLIRIFLIGRDPPPFDRK